MNNKQLDKLIDAIEQRKQERLMESSPLTRPDKSQLDAAEVARAEALESVLRTWA